MIDNEWTRLAAASTLIIDLRGSEGASSLVAAPPLPFVWTEKKLDVDSAPAVVLVSAKNIDFWSRAPWTLAGSSIVCSDGRPVALVTFSTDPTPAPPRPARLSPAEQRVIILVDHATVSAAEQVVLWARAY